MGCTASITNLHYTPTKVIPTPKPENPKPENPDQKNAEKRNAEIDRELQQYKNQLKKVVKLLLLGAGECGKSTILKQIRILHAEGFNNDDLLTKRQHIIWNILESIQAMVEAMDTLGLKYANHEFLIDDITKIRGIVELNYSIDHIDEPMKMSIKRIWADAGIQECYEHRNKFQLPDGAKHFLDQIDHIARPDYVPTIEDVLRCRVQTTGVVHLQFPMEKLIFNVVDVGGQRSERRKWIYQFDDVNSVIFVAALSEYDQVCAEDETTNRMLESLELFNNVCNGAVFKNSAMIIFLNKKDLFEEKIGHVPLTVAFPTYSGDQTYSSCINYIKDSFLQMNRNEQKQIFVHETCATDTKQLEAIFKSVWTMIMKAALDNVGIE